MSALGHKQTSGRRSEGQTSRKKGQRGTELGDPDHVGYFDPLVMIFTDAGDLVFVHVGQGWSLLLLDLPLPPRPGWFVLQIRSASGEFGPYAISVS